jgi:SAM-dependent methyltransferase
MRSAAGPVEGVIWHDVECGGYAADLPLWDELAASANGPALDLGCGTGRVALHLARRGHEVVGVDREPSLVAELNARAGGLPAQAVSGDAASLDLGREFALALAPMQLVQLLADEAERGACLRGVAAHLSPGGTAALAIVEQVEFEDDGAPFSRQATEGRPFEPPLPDTREIDGIVYSSLPLPTDLADDALLVRRLRQTVSPEGLLSEEEDTIRLRVLDADRLEREAQAVGLVPLPRRQISPTPDHVGSTVVLLRKGGA